MMGILIMRLSGREEGGKKYDILKFYINWIDNKNNRLGGEVKEGTWGGQGSTSDPTNRLALLVPEWTTVRLCMALNCLVMSIVESTRWVLWSLPDPRRSEENSYQMPCNRRSETGKASLQTSLRNAPNFDRRAYDRHFCLSSSLTSTT